MEDKGTEDVRRIFHMVILIVDWPMACPSTALECCWRVRGRPLSLPRSSQMESTRTWTSQTPAGETEGKEKESQLDPLMAGSA